MAGIVTESARPALRSVRWWRWFLRRERNQRYREPGVGPWPCGGARSWLCHGRWGPHRGTSARLSDRLFLVGKNALAPSSTSPAAPAISNELHSRDQYWDTMVNAGLSRSEYWAGGKLMGGGDADRPTPTIVIPAKAGTHPSARVAERWVPGQARDDSRWGVWQRNAKGRTAQAAPPFYRAMRGPPL